MNTAAKPRYILAVDPGSERSAWLLYNTKTKRPETFGIQSNAHVCCTINMYSHNLRERQGGLYHFVIENMQSMGMAVGASVFNTLIWIGKMESAWYRTWMTDTTGSRIYRSQVKMHLCGSMRAKDTNVRHALMNRYGGDNKTAVGTKKKPGPLYGIVKDLWSSLALAVTYSEQHEAAG